MMMYDWKEVGPVEDGMDGRKGLGPALSFNPYPQTHRARDGVWCVCVCALAETFKETLKLHLKTFN